MIVSPTTFSLLSAYATLAIQIVSFYFFILLITSWRARRIDGVLYLVSKYAHHIAWASVTLAALGSLYYSYVIGFEPCVLCWYQRIFMFPLIFILGLSLWRRDESGTDYALMLGGIGTLIAAYHVSLQFIGSSPFLPCSAEGVSCLKLYVLEFGYISIPVMSLTIFAWVMLVLIARRHFLATRVLSRS